MRAEVVTLTNMCMVYDDNGNVLVQDKVDKNWGGITFPGGHIEKGWERSDGTRYLVVFYKTNCFSGSVKSSAEGEVKWMSLKDMIKSERLADGMADMLRVFLEDDINEFHYYTVENGEWKYSLK